MTVVPVPGATVLAADDLTGAMMLPILAGPQASVVPLADVAQFVSDAGAMSNTNITTVGAGTLTAAGLIGGVITRSGSTAAYTDTTATAAQLLAALGADTPVGTSRLVFIKNTVAFAQTLAGGTDVTLAGQSVIPPLGVGVFLLTYDAVTPAFTLRGLGVMDMVGLPAAKITTGTGATFAAGDITGALWVDYINNASNATLTTRTAAQMFGDIPNCQIGFAYKLAIRNLNATGATLTAADASVTLSGTMTIAQNVTRTFEVVFTAADAVTITSMGISAAGA